MADQSITTGLLQVAGLLDEGNLVSLGDDLVLNRYVQGEDENASAALIARHGPLVLRELTIG